MKTEAADGFWVKEGPTELPNDFFELPNIVYATDPMWIPEDPSAIKKAFSPKNPWFRNNRAWVASLRGMVRLAVFCHPHDRLFQARRAAFFGYFESVGDALVNRQIFELAQQWARSQGALELMGPIDFTTFNSYRLRLSAEPNACTFPAEPYNPRDYPSMLESLGFSEEQRYLTQLVPVSVTREIRKRKAPRYRALLDTGYRFETLTPEVWYANRKQLHGLVNLIFAQNFAYTPISLEAFSQRYGEGFIRKACPITSTMAFGPQGDVAGFVINFPHYGPLVIQGARPERIGYSELDYQRHFPLLKQSGNRHVLCKTLGVNPVHRSQGVMDALGYHMTERGDEMYDLWYFAMIREGNHTARYIGQTELLERRYALYHKMLDKP